MFSVSAIPNLTSQAVSPQSELVLSFAYETGLVPGLREMATCSNLGTYVHALLGALGPCAADHTHLLEKSPESTFSSSAPDPNSWYAV
jgi:hypothetical protein